MMKVVRIIQLNGETNNIFISYKKTTMKKENLFNYLDAYSFAWKTDIMIAIEDYFRESIEKNEERTPSYWELVYFWELAEEYMDYADYIDEWF